MAKVKYIKLSDTLEMLQKTGYGLSQFFSAMVILK